MFAQTNLCGSASEFNACILYDSSDLNDKECWTVYHE